MLVAGISLLSWDHPRSRGVYEATASADCALSGSSPLARGLHRRGRAEVRRRGIIPARAGFTWPPTPLRSQCRDHPRSRGVYMRPNSSILTRFGSSPLARGLRRRRRGGDPGHADHPRSRGVYCPVVRFAPYADGSSPLARGLRLREPAPCRLEGIIPARAGFTSRSQPETSGSPDHPRSRGVYGLGLVLRLLGGGSSPLARGLLIIIEIIQHLTGIIPARAGFTIEFILRSSSVTDHPRSRGVYGDLSPGAQTAVGSSPLARGLPDRGLTEIMDGRIIPARAGFTPAPYRWTPTYPDHPRSRGVYEEQRNQAMATIGSSPLARGLQTRSPSSDPSGGIIPARAGFTTHW